MPSYALEGRLREVVLHVAAMDLRLFQVETQLKELQSNKTKKWKVLKPQKPKNINTKGLTTWAMAQKAAWLSLKAIHSGSGRGNCSGRGSDSGSDSDSDSDSDRSSGIGRGSDRDRGHNDKYNGKAKDVNFKTGGMKRGTALYKETQRIFAQYNV